MYVKYLCFIFFKASIHKKRTNRPSIGIHKRDTGKTTKNTSSFNKKKKKTPVNLDMLEKHIKTGK